MPILIGPNRTLLSRPKTSAGGAVYDGTPITNEADVNITDENDQVIVTPNED